jgi:trans-2,3-dihydro-3-hydroxyanthranilate isomerase
MPWFEFTICDVFTDRPLAGNQLAVFPEAPAIDPRLLARLAREINFSETVFVYPPAEGGTARVRIFTPGGEIPFAGHPVLGTAIVLGRARRLGEVVLETGRDPVPVRLAYQDAHTASGWMRQPVPSVAAFDDARLLPALGVARSELPVEVYDNGIRHVYVTLPDEAAVAALRPDFARLADLGLLGLNCVAGRGTAWKSRMFGPAHGVAEDPATGSAAGPLACHLARHGRIAYGQEIVISQGAEIGRPSRLLARVEGDSGHFRAVEVGGSAVVVGRGAFRSDLPAE